MKAKLIKLALSVLTSEKGRRAVGWILVAAFSPLILIIAFLCALGSGEAAHNNSMVEACFYGVEISDKAPQELKAYVRELYEKTVPPDVRDYIDGRLKKAAPPKPKGKAPPKASAETNVERADEKD